MPRDNYNAPLELINKKPQNLPFYMYPSEVIKYACETLNGTELKLYLAISGQAGKDKLNKPYHWTLKHYCQIAHLKTNHYQEILQGLCDKGFIIHNKFESIEVLYPIRENEYLTENGELETRQDSSKGKSVTNEAKSTLPKREEGEQEKGNYFTNLRNNFSQSCANNKYINNIINNSNNYKEIANSPKGEFATTNQKAKEEQKQTNWADYL